MVEVSVEEITNLSRKFLLGTLGFRRSGKTEGDPG